MSDQTPVLVNSRLESIYWRQFTAYMRVAERNRANGASGGRPKGTKSKPKENPVGSQTDTETDTKRNPGRTRKEKREKITPSEDLSGDKSPDAKGAEAPGLDLAGLGERMDVRKPFGLCYATLYLLHANLGQTPPPHDDAKKHLKGTTKLLGLASELGPEVAADLIAWVWEHNPGGKTIPAVYENRAGFLRQMANGVAWVPRRQTPGAGKPTTVKAGIIDALAGNPWKGGEE